jgi:uncharacterized membrane protein YccC
MTAATFITYLAGEIFGLAQSQWAVLTAIIVMQVSVGASLKLIADRLVGSLGGAIAGVAVLAALHWMGMASSATALLIGVPPLALLAAVQPGYRVAPVTFIVLVLAHNFQATPLESAFERMLEISIGSVVSLGVSLTILPARAHEGLAEAASQALTIMAELMTALPEGLNGSLDGSQIEAMHAQLRTSINKAETAASEALRERASYLSAAVDPLPMCRTLRRLRHDLAALGRITAAPFAPGIHAVMTPALCQALDAVAKFLASCSKAIADRLPPPPLADLDAAFALQFAALAQVRERRLARELPDEELGRIFGLGFTLDQLHRDLLDLVDRGVELARSSATAEVA